MRDRIESRISDEPARGWVDDELGLILNPSSDRRAAARGTSRGSELARALADGTPRAPSDVDGNEPLT